MFLTLFLISLLSFSNTSASSFTEMKSRNTKKQLDLTVPPGAKIFFQGWTKYFHSPNQISKPTQFFINKQFEKQRYPAKIAQTGDKNGSFVIPDNSSFFVVLYKDQLSIYSSRDEIIRHSVDTLLIEDIKPVPEDDFLFGGIKNLGKYKAGYCMKVKAKSPAAFNAEHFSFLNWYFCFDSLNKKSQFIKSLAKVKILQQRSNDNIVTAMGIKDEDLKDKLEGKQTDDDQNITSGKDGKMVLLQDWTECNLKCGGGKSFQQWMCVPPKPGGKPCVGDLIRTKECNSDPCPVARNKDDEKNNDEEELKKWKKPTVKITRFSQRFNRYTKCMIMETDIFKIDEENNKLPARIVMNPSTLTIFGNDDYSNKIYSFDLSKTEMKVMSNEFCCFELKDNSRKNKFCGFDTACGDPETNPFVTDLKEKFNEFKQVCNKGKTSLFIDDEDQKKIKKGKQKALQLQNFAVENKKNEEANQELIAETDNKVFKKIAETQSKGLKALEREIMIENLIKRDEQKKQDEEEIRISAQLEAEKRKAKEINKQIEEKELEEDFVMQTSEAQADIKESQKEISQIVEVNRERLRKQIEEIRKEAKKRRDTLHTKVKKVKSKITSKLLKANKSGDKTTCVAGLTNPNKRDGYCNASHPDDYLENAYCKEEDNFCYSCCDTEFGLLRAAQRDDCYETCDKERDNLEKAKERAVTPVREKKDMWQYKSKNIQQMNPLDDLYN